MGGAVGVRLLGRRRQRKVLTSTPLLRPRLSLTQLCVRDAASPVPVQMPGQHRDGLFQL